MAKLPLATFEYPLIRGVQLEGNGGLVVVETEITNGNTYYIGALSYDGSENTWVEGPLGDGVDGAGKTTVARTPAGTLLLRGTDNSVVDVTFCSLAGAECSDSEDMGQHDPFAYAYAPYVVTDASATATAAWQELDLSTATYYIVAARQTARGEPWSTPVRLGDVESAIPWLTLLSTGDVLATVANTTREYRASQEDWTPPSTLSDDASNVVLAATPNGNAVAIWFEPGGGANADVRAGWYDGTSRTWVPEDTTLDSAGGTASSPLLVVDAQGNATAAWVQAEDLLTRRYNVATGTWSAIEYIESSADAPELPSLHVDAFGNVTSLWRTGTTVWTRRYVSSLASWTPARALGECANFGVEMASDAQGRMLVACSPDGDEKSKLGLIWFR